MATASEHYNDYHHQSSSDHLAGNLHGKARLGFVRKVFGILAFELIFTALWIVSVKSSVNLHHMVKGSHGLGIFFAIITFIGTLTLALSKTAARTVPYNYAILSTVVFSMAWTTSYACTFYSIDTIMLAALGTAAAVGGIYFYALTSTATYNYAKAFLYSSLFILGFQLFSMFFLARDAYDFWISVLFSITTSISILYHMEAILGKKSVRYSQDDYIQAAMNLYIEIVQLFIELLKILDKLKDDEKNKKKEKK